MFCFEILSVDQELATSVATVDSRFVSPVTELLAPPIVSFGHFNHLRFFFSPIDFSIFFLRISKRNYRKSFLFFNIFIVLRSNTYAKNFNEEYIQKPLIYYRSGIMSQNLKIFWKTLLWEAKTASTISYKFVATTVKFDQAVQWWVDKTLIFFKEIVSNSLLSFLVR